MAAQENESFLDARVFEEMFVRPLLPHREKTALLIFEFGAFGQAQFRRALRVSRPPRSVPRQAASGVPLRGGDPQPGVSGPGLLRLPARAWRGPRLQRVVEDAGTAPPDRDSGFGDGGLSGLPRAPAPRARVRRGGGRLRALSRGTGSESRKRASPCAS